MPTPEPCPECNTPMYEVEFNGQISKVCYKCRNDDDKEFTVLYRTQTIE